MKATYIILACATFCSEVLAVKPKEGTWYHTDTCIENGGFENWGADNPKLPGEKPVEQVKLGSDGVPNSWRVSRSDSESSVSLMKDTEIKHSGLASARVEIAEPWDESFLIQHFSVEPNTSYMVRVWVRGEDIVPATGRPQAGILIWANSGPAGDEFYANQKSTAKQPKISSGTFDWQLFEFPVETSPEAKRLGITLQLRWASGTAWFDDVEVVKTETLTPVESH